jgi:sugar/nucleoside kinase (ribokinase family)
MCEALSAYGCEIIAVRRGPNGYALYDGGNHTRWTIPAYPARVVDPTGCADAFCGGFLAGYRITYSPLQSTLFGIISASMKVEGCGPFYGMDALPVLPRARLEALQQMVRKV